MNFYLIFQAIGAFFWTTAYILIIRKNIKEKTYGMPFLPMCINISWEFVFAFIYKTDIFHQIMCFIWFIFDFVIVITFLIYGNTEFRFSKLTTFLITLFTITATFIFMILAPMDFKIMFNDNIFETAGFIAYSQNLIMSILFVVMLLHRNNLKGQSIQIAICKWLGTICVGIFKITGLISSNPTEIFIILLIQFFDILYIYLILKNMKFNKQKIGC